MKYTKAYTTERAHQVEAHIGAKMTLNGIDFNDNYPSDLKALEKEALYCEFEKLQDKLDEIDGYIEALAFNDIMDDYDYHLLDL